MLWKVQAVNCLWDVIISFRICRMKADWTVPLAHSINALRPSVALASYELSDTLDELRLRMADCLKSGSHRFRKALPSTTAVSTHEGFRLAGIRRSWHLLHAHHLARHCFVQESAAFEHQDEYPWLDNFLSGELVLCSIMQVAAWRQHNCTPRK